MFGGEPYDYQKERPSLFTEEGVKMLLKVRDRVAYLLGVAGAARHAEIMHQICGDTYMQLACLDYLVEQKELVKLRADGWAQFQVYASPKRNDT